MFQQERVIFAFNFSLQEYNEAAQKAFEVVREIYDLIINPPAAIVTALQRRSEEEQGKRKRAMSLKVGIENFMIEREEEGYSFSNRNYISFKFQELLKNHFNGQQSPTNASVSTSAIETYSEQIIQKINQVSSSSSVSRVSAID